MKFLHAADLHIDSPLRGICFDDASAADRVRLATRDALKNLIRLAIDKQVDFIVIAGDLFDGAWPDMRTGLWTAEQFRRLREHNIRVYLIRGNHDARSVVTPAISWPSDVVHEFAVEEAKSVVDPRTGAVLHGQSFADRRALEDLAKRYPDAHRGAFNIGILHTSLAGDPQHDTYAPTSPEILTARGYHYWALGHIHQRRVIQAEPTIVFSGNTQGRHAKETGAKGCYLVTVENDHKLSMEFLPTDAVRWESLAVTLENNDDEADLFDRLPREFDNLLGAAEGRPVVARVCVEGSCRLHQHLSTASSRSRILGEIRNKASDAGELWIEKIDTCTRPAVDIDELRQSGDLIGQLLRSVDRLRLDDEQLSEMAAAFEPLVTKLGDALDGEDLNFAHPAVLRRYLDQAENLLLSELLGGDA